MTDYRLPPFEKSKTKKKQKTLFQREKEYKKKKLNNTEKNIEKVLVTTTKQARSMAPAQLGDSHTNHLSGQAQNPHRPQTHFQAP